MSGVCAPVATHRSVDQTVKVDRRIKEIAGSDKHVTTPSLSSNVPRGCVQIPLSSLSFVGVFPAAPGGSLRHKVNTVPDNEP